MTVAVGKDVDSWCTRCKLMLAHTVESMLSGKITRVHCNTCRSQHAYRPYPPGEQPVERRAPRPAAHRVSHVAKREPRAAEYTTLLSGRDTSSARTYTTQDRFAPTELIIHPIFGLGVVMVLKDRTKIDEIIASIRRLKNPIVPR